MSDGHDTDEAVRAMLETVTGHDVHVIRVPPGADVPYTILYPLMIPPGTGAWADPEEDRDYRYQATVVGTDRRQVRRLQEMVTEGFLQQSEGSGYEHAITPGDLAVQWRRSEQLGAIEPSGDDLFKADNVYRVRVGR
jgi:hypothetical protein